MNRQEILLYILKHNGACRTTISGIICEDCPLVEKCERNTLEYPDEHALTYKQAIAMYADRFGSEDIMELLL